MSQSSDKFEETKLTLAPTDRILVIAPHPDDEAIGAAGVIQEAVRQNIPVKVMYVTNGDSNSLAFLYYKKYPVFSRKQALEMGKLRQQESKDAAQHLGLGIDQIVYLGYPDFGTLKIFKNYWKTSRLYRGVLTKADHVPYEETLTPGAPYNAESILADFKKVLLDFKPTRVFVTHPADMNEDHQAAYLFLKIALWDLADELSDVRTHSFFIHAVDWPRPVGLFPEHRMEYLPHLNFKESRWENFLLDSGQIQRKEHAIGMYRTQLPYKPNFLLSFVRLNEPFADVSPFHLDAFDLNSDVWSRLQKEQKTCLSGGCIADRRARYLKSVVYALNNDSLIVHVRVKQTDKDFKLELFVFGYRNDVAFDQLPKIKVDIDRDFYPVVRDGKKFLRSTDVKIVKAGSDMIISVPLRLLGNPQKVIASLGIAVNKLYLENTAWTFLEL